MGGTIAKCPKCYRLVIYGQVCICGQVTHMEKGFVRKGHVDWIAYFDRKVG